MSRSQAVRLFLPALALALTVAALCMAAGARAESYGELGHFGSAGTGHEQFRLTGPTINGTSGTRAFGVDTTDNMVYVGDEPKAKEYRIQALTSAGKFVAATAGFKPPGRDGIEGIAIDPVLKRLYVLALERRGTLENAPSKAAAGTLYAFSTDATGEVLPPAEATVEGVLTGPTALHPQSDVLGDALIDPKGIAVDPTSHDVIVTGEVAEGEEAFSFALQRINASTGVLGARYVDHSGLLAVENHPNSPVVSQSGAVYVEQTEKVQIEVKHVSVESVAGHLMRIPEFSSTQPSTPFVTFLSLEPGDTEDNPVVSFTNGSGESLEGGGGLSLSQEAGGDGTFYAEAGVFEETSGGLGSNYTGALAFEDVGDSESYELGWTGGQSVQASKSCTIGISGPTSPMIAGGAAGTVFILDAKSARVVEFGPGGGSCPTAEASELTAQAGGAPISAPIAAGTEVTLASSLTRANALSVEWSFGEGEAKPLVVPSDEYGHTQITHTFEAGGELTVTETIHTDNLATPTIVKTTKISVRTSHVPPNAVISGPVSIGVGQAASFDGSASWDPNGTPGSSAIESYRWDFGDGDTVTSKTPEIEHTYIQTGVYVVKLAVVDGYGLESEPREIDVTVDVPVPSKPTAPSSPGTTGILTVSLQPNTAIQQPVIQTQGSGSSPSPTPVPEVRLASTSLIVARDGIVTLPLSCPVSESSCMGTVILRSATALKLTSRKRPKTAILTFSTGTFTIVGGRRRSLGLRLSSAARTLLTHTHTLHTQVTILARDMAGTTHTTREAATLHATPTRGLRK